MSVKDSIITVDKDMVVIEINEAAKSICNLSRDSIEKPFESLLTHCEGRCIDVLSETVNRKKPVEIYYLEPANPILDGTSLIDGPCADTNLGKVFREANKSTSPDFVKLVDFESYSPSYDSAASFIASPIFDDQRKVGILIFQMPIDRINMVMTNNHKWKVCGLGESGETYIIGSDYKMRSQSRFLIEDKEGYHALMAGLGMEESTLNVIESKDSTILL
jgi:hypothetical protein